MDARRSSCRAAGVALVAVVAGTLACVDKSMAPVQAPMVVMLDITPTVAAQIGPDGRSITATVGYERASGQRIQLATGSATAVPDASNEMRLSVGVNTTACFADSARTGGLDVCRLLITVAVRDLGNRLLDSVNADPVNVTAAGASQAVTVMMTFVASVTIESSTPDTAIVVGLQRQLSATLRTAGGTVVTGRSPEWRSLAPSVASVNSAGLVTALAPGSAPILVTSGLGEADRVVTVRAPAPTTVVILSITDAGSGLPVALNDLHVGQTLQLAAQVSVEPGFTAALQWSTSNGGVIAINAAGIAALSAPGSSEICAIANVDPTARACITLTVLP